MTEHQDATPPMINSIARTALMLAGFAAISTSLLSLTHEATREAIANSERQALLRNLQALLPPDHYDNDLLQDHAYVRHSLLGTHLPVSVYRARRQGEDIAALIASQAPNGYNGRIGLLVCVRAEGTLCGVRVTHHKETPGLGDDIELSKSAWVLSFNGKSLTAPSPEQWAVKKDGGVFDQFTGATITPRAIVAATYHTLVYAGENRDILFTTPATVPLSGSNP